MGAPRARRAAALLCAVAVVASLGSPATAAKKKPAAKPVETKLFFHGTLPSGEVEYESSGTYLSMSPAEAAGSEPRSYQITNYVGGPNPNCAGNGLFPVWVGRTSGKIVGDLKLTLHTVATGGTVEMRVWPDVNSQLCDSTTSGTMEYIDPVSAATVTLPAGHGMIEVVLPNAEFTAQAFLMVQVTPVLIPPFFGRVLYDTSEFASILEFSCVPTSGTKCSE